MSVVQSTDANPRLTEYARQLNAAPARATQMPVEAVQGYPVPVLREGETWLAFPYFLRSGRPGSPPKITAPGWIGYIDVATGQKRQFVTLEKRPGEPIGEHSILPPMKMAEFRAAEAELYALIGALLGVAQQPGRALTAQEQEAARRFARLWGRIAHKPLQSYYRGLNPAWFARVTGG